MVMEEPTLIWNALLPQVITSLQTLLSELRHTQWAAREDLVLKNLQVALQNASSLAAKWKKSRLRLLFETPLVADELSNTLGDIRESFGMLEVPPDHRSEAIRIEEELDKIILGPRDIAETDFKTKLLDFLRQRHTSKDTISVVTWLAKHLGTEVASIRQELQEIKENADTILQPEQEVDNKLLEQLILYLTELEEKKCTSDEISALATAKAKYLDCSICRNLMKRPVVIDSGESFCKGCIDEQFDEGNMTCRVTKKVVSKRVVANVTLEHVISCFGQAEVPVSDSSSEGDSSDGRESSDAKFDGHFDEPLEKIVKIAAGYLGSPFRPAVLQGLDPFRPTVLQGLDDLIKCATFPSDRLEVLNAKAIPAAIKLAETQDPDYSKLAVKLLEALTSSHGVHGGNKPDSQNTVIILEVAKALDVLISLMKETRLTTTRVLAGETFANILVNKQVRKTVRNNDGIVPALFSFSNVDAAGQRSHLLERADRVYFLGLTRLAKYSMDGDKDQAEAVIRADGHAFLLTSLEENLSKQKAAEGLLNLIKNTRTSGDVLEAGFVTTAVGSIDQRSACTEIALALASICTTEEGLDQIYASPHSVSALLILLEHCPDLSGKDAAAAVIAKLYPRLNNQADSKRQEKLTSACGHLIGYIQPLDRSHIKEFLEALAAIAAGINGRLAIHEERGRNPLIKYLSEPDIRDLVLKILAEMSCDIHGGVETSDSRYHRIRDACMKERIANKLFPLVQDEEFNKNTESMKNLLILIRNLSLAGPFPCDQLSEQGAVTVLLRVVEQHVNQLTIVTELAVKALEKLMDNPRGKQDFVKGGGARFLVAVLKLDAHGRTHDTKSFSTIILTAVAKDAQTRRHACKEIYECGALSALNEIVFYGETTRIRWQAAVLMKLLAMYGPTKSVCIAMKDTGCLHALISLKGVQHCEEMADDVLKFVAGKSSACKNVIDNPK